VSFNRDLSGDYFTARRRCPCRRCRSSSSTKTTRRCRQRRRYVDFIKPFFMVNEPTGVVFTTLHFLRNV